MNPRHARIDTVADALASLGTDTITQFDEAEPEYGTFQRLSEEFGVTDDLYLLGISAGIVDYQLNGDAQQFWTDLERIALNHGQLDTDADIDAILDAFMDQTVNARLNEQKRARLRKLLDGRFPNWFRTERHDHPPKRTWVRVADALGTQPQKKTIVFAMKVYDIIHLIETGEYLAFPPEMPIPCDLQIERVTRTAGLLPPGEYSEEIVHDVWADVMEQVNDQIEQEVSVLRVDSIVWQLGQVISTKDAATARTDVTEYLVEDVGLDHSAASLLAEELTETVGDSE